MADAATIIEAFVTKVKAWLDGLLAGIVPAAHIFKGWPMSAVPFPLCAIDLTRKPKGGMQHEIVGWECVLRLNLCGLYADVHSMESAIWAHVEQNMAAYVGTSGTLSDVASNMLCETFVRDEEHEIEDEYRPFWDQSGPIGIVRPLQFFAIVLPTGLS